MKTLSHFLFTALTTVIVILLLRIFVIGVFLIPSDGMSPTLLQGERIMVSKKSYGIRLPLMGILGYNRWGYKLVRKNDVVVFNNPADMKHRLIADKDVYIGRCAGTPGESIYVDETFKLSLQPSSMILSIPKEGEYIEVTPWNAMLLCNTLILHEGRKAEVRDGSLLIDGKPVRFCRFTKDYYWVVSDNKDNVQDSRMIGLVPHTYLIGKAQFVAYSSQWSRFLKEIK
ncbi:MAG: signal peptidase I [Bacteroidaceae bacterium]|nr:signal peptidase I [Bacteroidaceae bacterium]